MYTVFVQTLERVYLLFTKYQMQDTEECEHVNLKGSKNM